MSDRRRIVVAFDPDHAHDDPGLLRTAILLLRAAALTAVTPTGAAEVATVEERVLQAIEELARLDPIRRSGPVVLSKS